MKTTPLHILAVLASLISPALAGPLREAKIHQIVNDVKIVEPRTGARPATLRDTIKDDIGVTTGPQSRAELLFQDNTLTRLGAETFFSFEPGTRNVNLERGSMLLQVPKNQGGAHIRAASVSASITGTTITVEHQPGKRVKITVLEGSLDVNVDKRPADRVTLRAGKTITITPKMRTLPQPTEANLRNVVGTSLLVTPARFNAKSQSHAAALPSMGLIEKEIARQEGAASTGGTASAAAAGSAPAKISVASPTRDRTEKNTSVASSDELAALLATASPDASGKVKFSSTADLAASNPAAKTKSGSNKTFATSDAASTQLTTTSARSEVLKAHASSGNTSGSKTSTTTSLVAVNSTTGSSGGGASGSGGGGTTTTSTTTSLLGSSSAATGGSSLPSGGGTTSGRGSSYWSAFIAAVTSAINTAIANGGTTTGGSSGSGSGGGGKSGSSKTNKKS